MDPLRLATQEHLVDEYDDPCTEQDILDSLATWRKANPKKRWPPRQVIIIDGPVNVCKVGFVMSYSAGCTQIATGVAPDGSPDCTWYRPWMWARTNGARALAA